MVSNADYWNAVEYIQNNMTDDDAWILESGDEAAYEDYLNVYYNIGVGDLVFPSDSALGLAWWLRNIRDYEKEALKEMVGQNECVSISNA